MAQNKRKPAATKKGVQPFYYVLGGLALAGILLIGVTVYRNNRTAMAPPKDLPPIQAPEQLVNLARGITRGPASAPVKVMVFSDYMCPACALYATSTSGQMRATFGDRVTEVYQDYPLTEIHQYSFLAARAGRCAEDQNKFWELHDILFNKQRDWSFSRSAPIGQFGEYAAEAGLDRKAFDSCLASEKHADLVNANRQLGEAVGVNGTPTIYINGRQSANPNSWNVLKAEIEQALGPAK